MTNTATRDLLRGTEPLPLNAIQRRILRLVSYGHRTDMIAAQLGVTLDTAKWHRRQILDKLGAMNMANAVALGYEHGILR